jgi:D-aminoacyl-tRNA deacylase
LICVAQRVSEARVVIGGAIIGEIGVGLLVLVCAERGDGEIQADKLLAKLLKLRIFSDDAGKMNRSVQDIGGGLLLVSQFTLAADTASGMRPGFSTAAAPAQAEPLFARLVAVCRERHPAGVGTGRFGAHMLVSLANDGPVTFLLRT